MQLGTSSRRLHLLSPLSDKGTKDRRTVNLSHFTFSMTRVSVRKCGVGGGCGVRPKKPDYAANNLEFSGMRILLSINKTYDVSYKTQLFPIYRPQLQAMACSDAENRLVFKHVSNGCRRNQLVLCWPLSENPGVLSTKKLTSKRLLVGLLSNSFPIEVFMLNNERFLYANSHNAPVL